MIADASLPAPARSWCDLVGEIDLEMYPRYDEHPGMHTGATRMHTGERPYGNPPYATATWHRSRYEAGAAPTTTAYRWFGPWFGWPNPPSQATETGQRWARAVTLLGIRRF